MSKFFLFFILLFLCLSIQAETMDDEESDYQVIKDRVIPSAPANASNPTNPVIIHEKPKAPSFKVSEQPPTQVYSSPVLRQADRLSLERQKNGKRNRKNLKGKIRTAQTQR